MTHNDRRTSPFHRRSYYPAWELGVGGWVGVSVPAAASPHRPAMVGCFASAAPAAPSFFTSSRLCSAIGQRKGLPFYSQKFHYHLSSLAREAECKPKARLRRRIIKQGCQKTVFLDENGTGSKSTSVPFNLKNCGSITLA